MDENLVMTHSLNRGQVTLSANSDDEPFFSLSTHWNFQLEQLLTFSIVRKKLEQAE